MADFWKWKGDEVTGSGLISATGSLTVTLSSTATVVVSGTATVAVSGTATVAISGTTTVTSGAAIISASVTRPINATPYSIGDIVGSDPATYLTFSNASSVSGGNIIIQSANLRIDVAAVPAGMNAFRLHLYNDTPTAIADNSAFNLSSGDRGKYVGYVEFDTPVDLGDTLWSQKDNIGMKIKLSSTSLYGMLETRAAYTPTESAVKTVKLNVFEV